ncbi:MAG: ABC transporter permease [Candidatus Marinimicrobia bacterium]|jgi:sodium transport system permease protein|nr:ABC transporter permease [Candidatus Neomarinimicrobiota bacterium]MBT3633681.1 ABC transporter permease [Candidatus Neomarinimicrobiota bacterium]MBT3682366.1 ABC transporter permease [Candidatus Neomarinimicrobiota bacterium]MBT3759130.1 ABC transporter permease [Candidatus Neomarinimicrobiota bacterium]MBT3895597.1 ABC transporter permease [Candidatus Neomarinimicrobiota bacterium]
MRNIKIIYLKEMIDMIRDRRTLFFLILFPILFIPLMVVGFPKLIGSISEQKMTEILTVAIVGEDNSPELTSFFRDSENIIIIMDVPKDSIESSIISENIDAAVVISDNFENDIQNMIPALIELHYRSSDDMDALQKRLSVGLNKYANIINKTRYEQLSLNEENFTPLNIQHNNIASQKEIMGKLMGGWLPYIFILYCFLGAMYPALDLGAGEKERRTLETILVSPASRMEILLGKFGVVTTFGILSSLMGLMGLYIGIQFSTELPPTVQKIIFEMLNIKTIATVMTLIIPVAIFLGALLLSLSIYSKTFKEAQSIIGPLNILIIFPSIIGTIPGVELTTLTAAIPIVNISLASKEIVAGTIQIPLLIEVYLTLLAMSALSLYLAVRMFHKEEVIFRG